MRDLFGALFLRTHLLVFNNWFARQTVLDFLDTRPEVLNWYAFLDSGIFIISRHNAAQLSEILRQQFPGLFFVIAEVPRNNANGWLPQAAWEFINNPRSSGRWE